jgi:glycosyltransferase involved in cell wall biosynthesis
MEYPEITILVPTWNRARFLPLFVMNLKTQTYPQEKLKLIIDDDGDSKFITDIEDFKKAVYPIKVKYITHKKKRSIGEKRNDLVKECDTKIFCFMDDDDIYMADYILYSYVTLNSNKVGCVGSDKMLFCMSQKNYDIHAINCGDNKRLIHEATLMMTKKYFKASCKFAKNSRGEGANIFTGHERNVKITDIGKVMCCLQHEGNTIDKLQFAKDDNKVNMELSDEMKQFLDNLLKK